MREYPDAVPRMKIAPTSHCVDYGATPGAILRLKIRAPRASKSGFAVNRLRLRLHEATPCRQEKTLRPCTSRSSGGERDNRPSHHVQEIANRSPNKDPHQQVGVFIRGGGTAVKGPLGPRCRPTSLVEGRAHP